MNEPTHVIDRPVKSLKQVLPFRLRRKFLTQHSNPQIEQNKLYSFKNRINRMKFKNQKSLMFQIKFIAYELGNINKMRQQLNRGLFTKICINKIKISQPLLVNQILLSKIQENVQAINYTSHRYEVIFQNLYQIFKRHMGLKKKSIMIAIGAISQCYYAFFQNCYEQPFSICCQCLIYIKIKINQNELSLCSMKKQKNNEQAQIASIKIELLCMRCGAKIFQLYGYKDGQVQSTYSPKKIHNLLEIQNQRKRIRLSVMVGSGNFKRLHINSSSRYRPIVSQRMNAASILSRSLNKSTTIQQNKAKVDYQLEHHQKQ